MYIRRAIEPELHLLLREYPVVTILGPRQSGKTTLAQKALRGYGYANLEDPVTREIAREDPKGLLSRYGDKVVLDEVQRVPELLSYIQVQVDKVKRNGQIVLTGSHQLGLREAISQSLAGRTAILHLLPFSVKELTGAKIQYDSFEDYCFKGFLPRIYEESQRPTPAYSNYYQTYIERDVRQLIQLKDASLFEKMIKLLAGRVGQLLDYSSLANDVGVDAMTVRNWISILEASFIVFKLPPYFENFGKRVIKSPKYYFTEVGLLCFLLGIRERDQVTRDPLVGQIFENLVVIECLKSRYNKGLMPDLYFFRDSKGNEVDVVAQSGRFLKAIEIKSGSTFAISQLRGIRRFKSITDKVESSTLVYTGEAHSLSDNTSAISFTSVDSIF